MEPSWRTLDHDSDVDIEVGGARMLLMRIWMTDVSADVGYVCVMMVDKVGKE